MSNENNPLAPFWVDGEQGERYQCRPLAGLDALEVMPEIDFEDGKLTITGRGLRLAVMRGMVGWEGRAEPFNQATISRVSPLMLRRCADAIITATQWTEDQAKNS